MVLLFCVGFEVVVVVHVLCCLLCVACRCSGDSGLCYMHSNCD